METQNKSLEKRTLSQRSGRNQSDELLKSLLIKSKSSQDDLKIEKSEPERQLLKELDIEDYVIDEAVEFEGLIDFDKLLNDKF